MGRPERKHRKTKEKLPKNQKDRRKNRVTLRMIGNYHWKSEKWPRKNRRKSKKKLQDRTLQFWFCLLSFFPLDHFCVLFPAKPHIYPPSQPTIPKNFYGAENRPYELFSFEFSNENARNYTFTRRQIKKDKKKQPPRIRHLLDFYFTNSFENHLLYYHQLPSGVSIDFHSCFIRIHWTAF
jgi:hypothetical protein